MKKIISMFLALVLLLGTLATFSGCGEDEETKKKDDTKIETSGETTGEAVKTDEPEDTDDAESGGEISEKPETAAPAASEYDGAWWSVDEDVLYFISGAAVTLYAFDDEELSFIDMTEYFAGLTMTFDAATHSLIATFEDEDGDVETESVTMELLGGDLAALLQDGEVIESLFRISMSPDGLRFETTLGGHDLENEALIYCTADARYGLALHKGEAIFFQIAAGVEVGEGWTPEDDDLVAYGEAGFLFTSHGTVIVTVGESEVYNLRYTLNGDQLTIVGMDQIKMEGIDGTVSYPGTLTFELVFAYDA